MASIRFRLSEMDRSQTATKSVLSEQARNYDAKTRPKVRKNGLTFSSERLRPSFPVFSLGRAFLSFLRVLILVGKKTPIHAKLTCSVSK